MSGVIQSARGASAFTQPNRSFFSTKAEGIPHSWTPLIDELLRIRNLNDDWDGEGTEAPHPHLVDAAILLAQNLAARSFSPAERVIASGNGTIYFEWHTPRGYQEIEVLSPLDAVSRFVPKDSNETTVVRLTLRP